MATRTRKRRYEAAEHYPPPELPPATVQLQKPVEVIVVESQSPQLPPSSSYEFYQQQQPRYNHVPVAASSGAYVPVNGYPSDMPTTIHPPPYPSDYIPGYPQLAVPTYLPHPPTYPPVPNGIVSGYYPPSSPAESYATTNDTTSRHNSIARRIPQQQIQQLAQARHPQQVEYIDLTNSPPGSLAASAPKRRKKDTYYDQQQQLQQQTVVAYPGQQYMPAYNNNGPYYREVGNEDCYYKPGYYCAIQYGCLPYFAVSGQRDGEQGKPAGAVPVDDLLQDESLTSVPQQQLPPCADKEGHFIVNVNTDLTNRYKIMKLLGQGTFGKVVEAFDRLTGKNVAIKVIRAVQKYRDASKVEIKVLNTLKRKDPENKKRCIHLIETFDHRNHICMVFELLSQSVFDFLKGNAFQPFPQWQIKAFALQILEAVAFLHELGLIHTDLKPENIMLEDNRTRIIQGPRRNSKQRKELLSTSIRLIDFGSAIFEEDYHSSVVSTRHYRAPEIILCTGWSYPCDMWSVGCILVEFCTGDALFQTHDNLEHLAMMEAVLGKLPTAMIRNAGKTAKPLFRDGRLDFPNSETTKQSKNFVKKMKPLRDIIKPANPTTEAFHELVASMLTYDPRKRITAKQALEHRFFRMGDG